ncbi:archaellin/type IV pilin N-terminal domain-containing protein [Natronomonas marina]|jgi:flagellin FlaB|uniref:archaellin/type IV pilin N-terminal domain-containing protein n=1 Tax=Natronomonas marina TaxID=2961939 RepID=UPI0020C99ABF|nr:archaellin/type IV pilin N-terminal domain-containing protein [Natronomonas marina]
MRELSDTDVDRGQVGIGTLIIFIALVLVAAVAAGVLVNTAGLLQSQAEDTGSDAQSEVSNQIDVVSATGTVSSSSVSTVELVVKKSPGSEPINLSKATVQYTSDSSSVTLENASSTSSTEFSMSDVSGTDGEVLDANSDRIRIEISTSSIEGGNGLAAGEEATLEVTDQSGASTIYGVNVPDVLTGKDYVRV